MAGMAKLSEEMIKAGKMLAGDGLHPSSKGTRLSYSGGKRTVTDGPFAETKEVIGGYAIFRLEFEGGGARIGQPRHGHSHQSRCCGRPDGNSPDVRAHRLPLLTAVTARLVGLRPRTEDGVIGSRDGYRHSSRDRRSLAHRIAEAHRRAGAHAARRWPGRGAGAGCARQRARALAGNRHPGQAGRLADGHREASRDRPAAPQQARRAQACGARPRARYPAGHGAGPRRGARRRHRRRSAASRVHGLPSGALDRGARLRSRCACSAA